MPYIQVTIAAGRSSQLKQQLMQELSASTARVLGVDIRNVRAWILEVPDADMSVGGVALPVVRERRRSGDDSL